MIEGTALPGGWQAKTGLPNTPEPKKRKLTAKQMAVAALHSARRVALPVAGDDGLRFYVLRRSLWSEAMFEDWMDGLMQAMDLDASGRKRTEARKAIPGLLYMTPAPGEEDAFPQVIDETHGRRRLDQNLLAIGTPTGVVDISGERPQVMPDEEAHEHLVTCTTNVAYRPGAHLEDDIAAKLDLLSAGLRSAGLWERFVAEIGYSLRGQPDGRFLLLLGPTKGGKTTVIRAVQHAIGEYARIGRHQALTSTDARFEAFATWPGPARLVVWNESPRQQWNVPELKGYADGGSHMLEDKRKRAVNLVVNATGLISANDTDARAIGAEDEAWCRRLVPMDMEQIEELDPQEKLSQWDWSSVMEMAQKDVGLHEGLLSLLLEAACANTANPDRLHTFEETEADLKIEAARQRLRSDHRGLLGDFADRRLRVETGGTLFWFVLLDALVEEGLAEWVDSERTRFRYGVKVHTERDLAGLLEPLVADWKHTKPMRSRTHGAKGFGFLGADGNPKARTGRTNLTLLPAEGESEEDDEGSNVTPIRGFQSKPPGY